jgi:hypothetical protein
MAIPTTRLTLKQHIRVEVSDSVKRHTLQHRDIDCRRKKFYWTGPRLENVPHSNRGLYYKTKRIRNLLENYKFSSELVYSGADKHSSMGK